MGRTCSLRSARRGVRLLALVAGAFLFTPPTASLQAQTAERGDDATRIVAQVQAQDPDLARELERIRAATEKYRDVEMALADGYIPDPMNMCVTAEMEGMPRQLGEMGIHYFRPDLLQITGTEPRVGGMGAHEDFTQPGVLVYEPQADGSLALVAVENLIFQAGWEATGANGPPEFAGNQYFHLVNNPLTEVDEAHGFEPHYELHIWLYRENPSGLFAPFNPNVSCAHHDHGGHGVH
jgi:hypothetical protein